MLLHPLPILTCPICLMTLFPPSGIFRHPALSGRQCGAPLKFMSVVGGVALWNVGQGGQDTDSGVPTVGARSLLSLGEHEAGTERWCSPLVWLSLPHQGPATGGVRDTLKTWPENRPLHSRLFLSVTLFHPQSNSIKKLCVPFSFLCCVYHWLKL